MAIRLMRILCKSYPAASLTMVGPEKDGSLQLCKTLAAQLGVVDNITFTGKLEKDDWIKLAANHDIFINTSDFDNLPVSVIEAMALGLPVVSTNPGGIPFFIADNKDGVLVNCNDHIAMNDAVLSLLNNPSKGHAIALAARTKAETFDWNMLKYKWTKLLKDEFV